jgi:pimeloyl-ACP methyl ester carboxylesterase
MAASVLGQDSRLPCRGLLLGWGMRSSLLALLILTGPLLSAVEFDGKQGKFHGFTMVEFDLGDARCRVVQPKKTAGGRPWIWRARFWGHEPQLDVALLERGWHVAYCDVGNLFGSPRAVKRWDAFYEYLTAKHQFNPRPVLEGMSRGGLIIYNWAKANPEKVTCIYGDAPVCDFKSWPAGRGQGKASAGAWQACLKAYGLTEAQAWEFRGNPIDGLEPLAKAGVPLIHVVGDADVVVPVGENTDVLERRYKKLGGTIRVIGKPGVGHHPHSLKDPAQLVRFILQAAARRLGVPK